MVVQEVVTMDPKTLFTQLDRRLRFLEKFAVWDVKPYPHFGNLPKVRRRQMTDNAIGFSVAPD